MPDTLMATAVHEAGHAVCALGLGYPIRSITIVADAAAGIAGRVVFDLPPAADADVVVSIAPATLARTRMAEAVIVGGGEVAMRLAGFDTFGLGPDDHEGDRLSDDVLSLTGVPPWRWRHLARAVAESYLRQHWHVVQRLTDALLAEGTITGARANQLAGDLPLPDMRGLRGALDFWSRRAEARAMARPRHHA